MPSLAGEDVSQLILVMISIACFGMSLFLVVLNFVTAIPYFQREKSLIIALLFLLMGVLCIQVLQFIRWQRHDGRPLTKKPPVKPAPQKRVFQGYVTSDQNR